MPHPRTKRPRRLRLLPVGWAFVLMMLLGLPMAWNTGNQLLYLLFAGVCAFPVLSLVWAVFFSVRGLTMSRVAPHAVQRSEPFWVRVRIENRRRLIPAFSLCIGRAALRGDALAHVVCLPAGRAVEIAVRHRLAHRGPHVLEPYALRCSYPFGLIERRRVFADQAEVLVYPRVHAVRTNVVDEFGAGRQAPSVATGEGDEFFTLREYVNGDDPRHIAWRVSARLGKWIVREMSREHSRHVAFVLDARRRADVEDFGRRFEDAVEMLASLAITLLRRHYNVAVYVPGGAVDGGEGATHERRTLDLLARVVPCAADAPAWPEAVRRGRECTWAAVIVISPDPGSWGGAVYGVDARVLDPRKVIYA